MPSGTRASTRQRRTTEAGTASTPRTTLAPGVKPAARSAGRGRPPARRCLTRHWDPVACQCASRAAATGAKEMAGAGGRAMDQARAGAMACPTVTARTRASARRPDRTDVEDRMSRAVRLARRVRRSALVARPAPVRLATSGRRAVSVRVGEERDLEVSPTGAVTVLTAMAARHPRTMVARRSTATPARLAMPVRPATPVPPTTPARRTTAARSPMTARTDTANRSAMTDLAATGSAAVASLRQAAARMPATDPVARSPAATDLRTAATAEVAAARGAAIRPMALVTETATVRKMGPFRRPVMDGRRATAGKRSAERDSSRGPAERPAASGCRAVRCHAAIGGLEAAGPMITGKAGRLSGATAGTAGLSPVLVPGIRPMPVMVTPATIQVVRETGPTSGTRLHPDTGRVSTGNTAVGTAPVSRGRAIKGATGEPGRVRNGPIGQGDPRRLPIPRGRSRQACRRGEPGLGKAVTDRRGGVERGRGHPTRRTGMRAMDLLSRLTTLRCVVATLPTARATQMTREPGAIAGTRARRVGPGSSLLSQIGTPVRAQQWASQLRSREPALQPRCRLVSPHAAVSRPNLSLLRPTRKARTQPQPMLTKMSTVGPPALLATAVLSSRSEQTMRHRPVPPSPAPRSSAPRKPESRRRQARQA
jgi:hypothetical protein